VSYGAARHRLIAANRRRLHLRFPGYAARYERFAAFDPLKPARQRVLADLAPAWVPEPLNIIMPAFAQDQAHPHLFTLPQVSGGPVVILCAEKDLAGPLRKMRVLQLRLVPAASLSAAGLRLCPSHRLQAEMRDDELVVWSGEDANGQAPKVALACARADACDIASFEAAVLALLPNTNPGLTANALSF
jgi:hypothetical protein